MGLINLLVNIAMMTEIWMSENANNSLQCQTNKKEGERKRFIPLLDVFEDAFGYYDAWRLKITC